MASAVAALENAVVSFVVPGVGTVVDPATGNVVAETEMVQARAFLKGESVAETTFPGVNVITVLYEGYVTSGALDSRVGIGTTGSIQFAGQSAQDCEVLEVRLPYGESGLLGGILSEVLGVKVRLAARTPS
jgi:hypothetical protein